jgi:Holliday junction resolvase RusA-like endonuclease
MLTATIPGSPGLARVNAREGKRVVMPSAKAKAKGAKPRVQTYPSKGAKAWRALAVPVLRRAMAGRPAIAGPVSVELREYWPRRRHLDACPGLALGDVDAPIKEALDALRRAAVIDDDVQVRQVTASKLIDSKAPRIEIDVRPWSP